MEWPSKEDGQERLEITAFEWSAENGKEDCVRRLLRAKMPVRSDECHHHPISSALHYGHGNVIKAFIDYGEDIGNIAGWYSVQDHFTLAICSGHESVVRLMVDRGVRLEFKDSSEHQPLSYATEKGHVSIVKLLLDHGCNPLTPNYTSWNHSPSSAWTVAASSSWEILQMFIENLNGIEPVFPGSVPGVSDGKKVDDDVEPAVWPLGVALAHDPIDIELVKFLYDHSPTFKAPFSSYS